MLEYTLANILYEKYYVRPFKKRLKRLSTVDGVNTHTRFRLVGRCAAGRDVFLKPFVINHTFNKTLKFTSFLPFFYIKVPRSFINEVHTFTKLKAVGNCARGFFILKPRRGLYSIFGAGIFGYLPQSRYRMFLRLIYNKYTLKKRSIYKKFLVFNTFGLMRALSCLRIVVQPQRIRFFQSCRRKKFIAARKRRRRFFKVRVKIIIVPKICTKFKSYEKAINKKNP